MSENLTEKYTYGKTTTLVDTDDIGDMTEAIESVDQEVDTHVEEANAKFSEYDSKIASIESEMSNVKKSVSDGKSLVAGAITNKGVETAADATFETMATNIDSITTIESASANMTAAAGDMLANKTAIVAGKVVVGTIPSKAAATITPGTSNQTIAAGQYLAGDQTVKGDANLVAANIAKGKSIFGVTGTYDPSASFGIKTISMTPVTYMNTYGYWSKTTCTELSSGYVQVTYYYGSLSLKLPVSANKILSIVVTAFDTSDTTDVVSINFVDFTSTSDNITLDSAGITRSCYKGQYGCLSARVTTNTTTSSTGGSFTVTDESYPFSNNFNGILITAPGMYGCTVSKISICYLG